MITYQCIQCGHAFHEDARVTAKRMCCRNCIGWMFPFTMKGVWRFMHFTKLPRPYDELGSYMHRLQIVETPWFSVRLHVILHADEDPHPHDHPFDFVSFILFGWYEERRHGAHPYFVSRCVRWFNCVGRNDQHRIVRKSRRPVVSLVFTKGRSCKWGYRMETRWRVWTDYKDRQKRGLV